MPSLLLRNSDKSKIGKPRNQRLLGKEAAETVENLLREPAQSIKPSVDDGGLVADQCHDLRNEIEVLKQQLIDKSGELSKAQLEIEQYKSRQNNIDTSISSTFGKLFSKNQLDLIMEKNKNVKWTGDELSQAFTLRYYSKRAYDYLRKVLKYPLPGISTLQRWASKIGMRKGLLSEVFRFMQLAGEPLSELEK